MDDAAGRRVLLIERVPGVKHRKICQRGTEANALSAQ